MDVEQGAEHHDETNVRRKRAHSVQAEGSTAAAFRARMGSIGLGGQRRGSFSGGNRVTLAPIEGSKVTRKTSWAPGEPRKASNASKAHALAQIMGAADFSPIMIICYSLTDGRLTYVNNEVSAIERRDAELCAADAAVASQNTLIIPALLPDALREKCWRVRLRNVSLQ